MTTKNTDDGGTQMKTHTQDPRFKSSIILMIFKPQQLEKKVRPTFPESHHPQSGELSLTMPRKVANFGS